jgi:ketosteroid isomerase-like protein
MIGLCRAQEALAVSELDKFCSEFLPRQVEAERAMVLGDPEPRMKLWSRQEPITLFGAATGGSKQGWDELSRIFRWVASTFSEVSDFRYELEAAAVSGDLAYTVGYERFRGSIGGGPIASVTVRVTHAYRRERGEWRIVHRHGDSVPADQSTDE